MSVCDICRCAPATLVVPVMATGTGKVVRRERWCEPCRAKVFPPGRETAWRHRDTGWAGEGDR